MPVREALRRRVAAGITVGVGASAGEEVVDRKAAGVALPADGVEGSTVVAGGLGAAPQPTRLQVLSRSTKTARSGRRRMVALSLQHDPKEVAKDLPCHVIVFAVARGDHLLDVTPLLR